MPRVANDDDLRILLMLASNATTNGTVHKNCKIAYGATRRVILIGRYAIKFPAVNEWRLFLLGLLANMQERMFSKAGWPELCPVRFSIPGGFMIVMDRARPLTDGEWEYFQSPNNNDGDSFVQIFINKPDYKVPCEIKQDSFGVLNNKLVVVDYGN